MSGKPDKRVQDGWKLKLLCRSCEKTFGQWEKPFKERVFSPIHTESGTKVRYDSWMLKFAASVSWRVLKVFQLNGELRGASAVVQRQAEEALCAWKEFILGNQPHPGSSNSTSQWSVRSNPQRRNCRPT